MPKFLTPIAMAAAAMVQDNAAGRAVREWRLQHERAIVNEFFALLAIPNIARDRENIQRNAEAIAAMLDKRGVASRLVSVPGSNPVVYGEIRIPGATRTLVFHAHYDGQPLDPKEWASPPFDPALRDEPLQDGGKTIPLPAPGQPFDPEWRIYVRGSGDDKALIVATMTGLDAIRAAGLKTRSNIQFAFEGEEEAGWANLKEILTANKELSE
jgi:acetylornithine deacetylase/succinyl-diaminopimelate desuccinylase-like protein